MNSKDDQAILLGYISSAKSIIQLSSAGLVVPVVLKSKVLALFGQGKKMPTVALVFIIISWGMFLIAIGAGSLYEYAAIKYVEYRSDPKGTFVPRLLKPLVIERGPGIAYGLMIIAFYVGAIAVVVYSALALAGA